MDDANMPTPTPRFARGGRGGGSRVRTSVLEGGGGRGAGRGRSRLSAFGEPRTVNGNSDAAGAAKGRGGGFGRGHGRGDGKRWERGGTGRVNARGRAAPGGRRFPNVSLRVGGVGPGRQQQLQSPYTQEQPEQEAMESDGGENTEIVMGPQEAENPTPEEDEPQFKSQEEFEKFFQQLLKDRELERKEAIAEGKMDDPNVPKRLEDAFYIVGTCPDMCPRFERFRREREGNLFQWETIPGTKHVDHKRAVKMYERAAGDKVLPSDIRPPLVCKKTLDYLFHDLMSRGGFSPTYNFIRDRTRAVRNDFTLQHETGELAIECHDRCARFHILSLHLEKNSKGFEIPMEERQLMNTLQSLKEFYSDQRDRYQSPNELEMRVYHRLVHIRDQVERHEDVPSHISTHQVFKLVSAFRSHVQKISAPITRTSELRVEAKAMSIFGRLVEVLRTMEAQQQQEDATSLNRVGGAGRKHGGEVMTYLIACILERHFGSAAMEDMESIKRDLSIQEIIDGGRLADDDVAELEDQDYGGDEEMGDYTEEDASEEASFLNAGEANEAPPAMPSIFQQPTVTSSIFAPPHDQPSAFSNLSSTPNAFSSLSAFSNPTNSTSVFSSASSQPSSQLSNPTTVPTQSPFSTPDRIIATAPSPFGVAGSSTVSSTSPFSSNTKTSAFNPQAPAFVPSGFKAGFGVSSPFSVPSDPSSDAQGSRLQDGAITSVPNANTSSAPRGLGADNSSREENPFSFTNRLSGAPTVANIEPPSEASQSLSQQQLSSSSSLTLTPSSSFQIQSPLGAPPLLARPEPISLPPTPTVPPLSSPRHSSLSSPSLAQSQPQSGITSTGSASNLSLLQQKLRNTLQTADLGLTPNGSSADGAVLSPLVLQSPAVSRKGSRIGFGNFGPGSSSERGGLGLSWGEAASPLGTKEKEKRQSELWSASTSDAVSSTPTSAPVSTSAEILEPPLTRVKPRISKEELQAKSAAFLVKSGIVKDLFLKWKERTLERAAWEEVVKDGEAYQKKIKTQRQLQLGLSESVSESVLDGKKRRISTNGVGLTAVQPSRKRVKRRVSAGYQPPRTDEDLVRRLKENQEEHDRRWAAGSFLEILRKFVKRSAGSGTSTFIPSTSTSFIGDIPQRSYGELAQLWRIWLSLNPENDGTAIWLERKFGVPTSGNWESDSVFSIPLDAGRSERPGHDVAPLSPGVIVFECTPLGTVGDQLERKFRVLEDCARLRDLVKELPPKRHFVPSLLVVSWSDGASSDPDISDLRDMIDKLCRDKIISNYATFTLSSVTKDLDQKFDDALRGLSLDLEGRLVQTLTLPGVWKLFEPPLASFESEWVESCVESGEFDWPLYGHTVESCVSLQKEIARLSFELLSIPDGEIPLPYFDGGNFTDSEVVYEVATQWLEYVGEEGAEALQNIQSNLAVQRDFPAEAFLRSLHGIAFKLVGQQVESTSDSVFHIQKTEISKSLETFEASALKETNKLRRAYAISVRRSPKRCMSTTTDDQSHTSKRIRLSESLPPEDYPGTVTPSPQSSPKLNGYTPASPNGSVASTNTESKPPVSIAMLRTLTRTMREKYKT